mgnify:CR=1 FL=1
MMKIDDSVQDLVEEVRSNPKYQFITSDLVQQLCQDAKRKGLKGKLAVKTVRGKLHQIGGAYFSKQVDYNETINRLRTLPDDIQSAEVRQFCRQTMRSHTSTGERLPIIDTFFKTCLASLAPVHSVIDLACGLNPLAIPWIPLTEDFTYCACDIYEDMLGLLTHFFKRFSIQSKTTACNLTSGIPETNAEVAFLLKSIPCLEQIKKSFGAEILELIPTPHLLVSYPVHSIGGRKKGMPDFYRRHFYQLISGKDWEVQEFQFQTELAFMVHK